MHMAAVIMPLLPQSIIAVNDSNNSIFILLLFFILLCVKLFLVYDSIGWRCFAALLFDIRVIFINCVIDRFNCELRC